MNKTTVMVASALLVSATVQATEVAGTLLIELKATTNIQVDASGRVTNWTNTGTAGGSFIANAESCPTLISTAGLTAVCFDGGDYLRSTFAAPDAVTSTNSYSVEVWALNPKISDEECMVNWARRATGSRSAQFNYGTGLATGNNGAVSHWHNDMGWNDTPEAGKWHHLVVTFAGSPGVSGTERIYADGVLRNLALRTLDLWPGDPCFIGCAITDTKVPKDCLYSGYIGLVRVHSGVLSEGQVWRNYAEGTGAFNVVPLTVKPAEAETAGEQQIKPRRIAAAESEAFQKRQLAVMEQSGFTNTTAYAAALDRLVEIYCDQGDYDAAYPLYQRAAEIRKKETGWSKVVSSENATARGSSPLAYDGSYAFLVGNSRYTNGWPEIPGAVKDVTDVARVLESNGFSTVVMSNVTKQAFMEAFGKFADEQVTQINSRLLFYFAGHGYSEPLPDGGDLGYIVMVDARPSGDKFGFRKGSVDMQTLVTQSRQIQSRHVLFMLDSCLSGSILEYQDTVHPTWVTNCMANRTRQFITAGRATENVPDKSVFKEVFLDLLFGRIEEPVKDGYITAKELASCLIEEVPKKFDQHPQYGTIRGQKLDTIGDFIIRFGSGITDAGFPMDMVPIATGSFIMGEGDFAHQVTLTHPFKMGKFEVTRRQYRTFLEDSGYQWQRGDLARLPDDTKPIMDVSWFDAKAFCRWLTLREWKTLPRGYEYRLPTEAEWEYACRAGSTGSWCFGDDETQFTEYAWYAENSDYMTHPVGKKKANAWGLHDMHGNVWEWCGDWVGEYAKGSATDPQGPEKGEGRVMRGGSFIGYADCSLSDHRSGGYPDDVVPYLGFRVVCAPRP